MQQFELKDFQRATVDRLEEQLLLGTRNRMLVADEVGLGKTIVAKGFIERMMDQKRKLQVIYICNNQQIARQNLRKLNVTGLDDAYESHDRLSLAYSQRPSRKRGLRLLGLSPQTSLSKRSRGGLSTERLFLLFLLRQFKKLRRRKGVLSRFLRLDVGKSSWQYQWKRCEFDPPVSLIADFKRAVRATGLYDELNAHFDARLHLRKKNNRPLIAKLRQLLIEVSIDRMKPDLIILDEFQRFRELLQSGDAEDERAVLAQRLFRKPRTKILLLSATPYRMYVQRGEAGSDHYTDFQFLVHFLLEHDPERTAHYDAVWANYRRTVDSLTPERLAEEQAKGEQGDGAQVQRLLRTLICRTERAALTGGRGGMVRSASEHSLLPRPEDLLHYRQGELLTEKLREKGLKAYSPLNYYKSAPYPLSFMDGYKLSKLLRKQIAGLVADGTSLNEDNAAQTTWLPFEQINNYVALNYPNASFRYLMDHALHQGGERLLWVPPAQCDYPLADAFAGHEGYSKTLLFSQWRLVPRAVASLLSYEVERRTLGRLREERGGRYTQINYFNDREGDDPREPAKFSGLKNKDSRLWRSLTYPSLSLAILSYGTASSLDSLIARLRADLRPQVADWLKQAPRKGKVDTKWYWLLPVLLDQEKYGGNQLARVYERLAEWSDDQDWSARCKVYAHNLHTPYSLLLAELGRPPEDLVDVLALQVVGSPVIASLRIALDTVEFSGERISLQSANSSLEASIDQLSAVLPVADTIAEGLLKYVNTPEAAAAIRVNSSQKSIVAILRYCAAGNLTALLREYLHVVTEAQSLHTKSPVERLAHFRDEILTALSLRAASMATYHPSGSRRLRTHYAAAFFTEASDDKQRQRESHVRSAFNSPFRPFVLASTSVGQEGLDFHYYARHLMHWNLPHNPVDLEQREGRVNRYKSHAVRLGLVQQYGNTIGSASDYWATLFERAAADSPAETPDLVPYWDLGAAAKENPYPIIRHAPHLKFSQDARRLGELLRTLPLYRLALGMPDQEGLLLALGERFSREELDAFTAVFGMDLGSL